MDCRKLSRMIALEAEHLSEQICSAKCSSDVSYCKPSITKLRKDLMALFNSIGELKNELDEKQYERQE